MSSSSIESVSFCSLSPSSSSQHSSPPETSASSSSSSSSDDDEEKKKKKKKKKKNGDDVLRNLTPRIQKNNSRCSSRSPLRPRSLSPSLSSTGLSCTRKILPPLSSSSFARRRLRRLRPLLFLSTFTFIVSKLLGKTKSAFFMRVFFFFFFTSSLSNAE